MTRRSNTPWIVLVTLQAVAIYIVLGLAGVVPVPLPDVVKGAISMAAKALLLILGAVLVLVVLAKVLVVLAKYRFRYSKLQRLGRAHHAGDREEVRILLRRLEPDEALLRAAEYGVADIVKELFDQGVAPDGVVEHTDFPEGPPLILAASSGSEDVVRMLLAAGADVNRREDDKYGDGYSALERAVRNDHRNIVKLLLEYGADPTPEAVAFVRADADIVKLLVQHGADPNLALSNAITRGDLDLMGFLLARGADPDLALPDAIRSDDLDLVSFLYQHGADVVRALRLALESFDYPKAKYVLRHGIDLGVIKEFDWPDPEWGARLLIEIGEHKRAADVVRGAVGVELPILDETLLRRAEELRSLFLALAERYQAEGNSAAATRLCEWKASRGGSSPDTSIRLRVQAGIEEGQGDAEAALRHYRDALAVWQLDRRQGDAWWEVFRHQTELNELLRDCERAFAQLGSSDDRESVAAARRRLEERERWVHAGRA